MTCRLCVTHPCQYVHQARKTSIIDVQNDVCVCVQRTSQTTSHLPISGPLVCRIHLLDVRVFFCSPFDLPKAGLQCWSWVRCSQSRSQAEKVVLPVAAGDPLGRCSPRKHSTGLLEGLGVTWPEMRKYSSQDHAKRLRLFAHASSSAKNHKSQKHA